MKTTFCLIFDHFLCSFSYERARKVLNRAREAIPTEAQIWIAAARLEESHNSTNEKTVSMIISRAVTNLEKHSVIISRQKWLEDAYKAEASGSPLTASMIIRATIGQGLCVFFFYLLDCFKNTLLF